ncbi:helix-turn-helix domain-containing protein [Zhouia sp. PK063]|uniref:helix-turn-helix domain-containing protein n=1 Tax=Zhouia sp. PK063 TaxID=3373602 RepID=UPI00378E1E3C
MIKTQSLEEFCEQKLNWLPQNLQQELGQFNVFKLENRGTKSPNPVEYRRRDFYKIAISTGSYIYHYADKSIKTEGPTLMFFNPLVPYTYEILSGKSIGYFCIFREEFFTEHIRNGIHNLPMFLPGNNPAYPLSEDNFKSISLIFDKMLSEINSDYKYKYDLIRNYVTELIHQALKIKPTTTIYEHADANSRITAVFTELLERQFPIESLSQRFTMRSAKDFADQLSVHVNHLNRAIRTTTGKTTTDHISERLASEAKALLRHTSWNVSEISYALGFDDPTHFSHFFKKQTSVTPTYFRK